MKGLMNLSVVINENLIVKVYQNPTNWLNNNKMEYISLLKNRKSAMEETARSSDVDEKQRESINQSLKLMNYSSWAAKGLILSSAVFMVDWKKKVPFTKRELPLTIGALAICALTDYVASEIAWKRHEQIVVQFTGFRNGVYISPDKMKKMRSVYQKASTAIKALPEEQYFDDDEK